MEFERLCILLKRVDKIKLVTIPTAGNNLLTRLMVALVVT